MKKSKILGIMLISLSIIFSLAQFTFTGNAIGESRTSYFGIVAALIFVLGVVMVGGIERIVKERDKAHSRTNFLRLKERLEDMQKHELQGTDPKEVPIGRYLSPLDLYNLRKIIIKYLPTSLIATNTEIAVGGSLSRANKGRRYKKWDTDMLSDQFYLSDVDVGIESPIAFDYLEANWIEAIKKKSDGRGAGEETYRITNEDCLPKRERERAYMKNAPLWIKNMLDELSHYSFAGEKRPVNIKFYKNKIPVKGKDIIYKV